jgi:hypothetical protein
MRFIVNSGLSLSWGPIGSRPVDRRRCWLVRRASSHHRRVGHLYLPSLPGATERQFTSHFLPHRRTIIYPQRSRLIPRTVPPRVIVELRSHCHLRLPGGEASLPHTVPHCCRCHAAAAPPCPRSARPARASTDMGTVLVCRACSRPSAMTWGPAHTPCLLASPAPCSPPPCGHRPSA